jgi:hypothetical protein
MFIVNFFCLYFLQKRTLTAFYTLCLTTYHQTKENGLVTLKMRFPAFSSMNWQKKEKSFLSQTKKATPTGMALQLVATCHRFTT